MPPQPGDTSPQRDIALRVAALLAEDPAVHVVGHSFGGQIAIELALVIPQQLRSLTVICSRSSPFPPLADTAAGLRAGDPVDVDAGIARWFTAPEVAADGPVVRYVRDCLQHVDRDTWATALDAIAVYDAADRLSAIRVPTTLIAAELDPISTPSAMAETAGHIPDSSLQVIAGAAHMSPFVTSDVLVDRIRMAAIRGEHA